MGGRLCDSILGSLLLLALGAGCASRAPQSAVASDTTPDRIALNRFVEFFSVRVERAADEIAQQTHDPTTARNSVYWKMRAIPAAQSALLIADNQAAAIQLWVITAAQLETFDVGAAGFGEFQPIAQQAAKELDDRVKLLASTMLTPEQVALAEESVHEYVEGHVGRTGLETSPEEARTWSQSLSSILHKPLEVIEAPLSSLNPTSGLSDTALAMQNFTDEFSRARTELGYLPSELRWNTQLLLMEIEQRLDLAAMTKGVAQLGASSDSVTTSMPLTYRMPAGTRCGSSTISWPRTIGLGSIEVPCAREKLTRSAALIRSRTPRTAARSVSNSVPVTEFDTSWAKRALEIILSAGPIQLAEGFARAVYGWHLRRKAATWKSRDEVRLEAECLKLHTSSHRALTLARFERAMVDVLERIDDHAPREVAASRS